MGLPVSIASEPDECGRDIGGVWLPQTKGSKAYYPLSCNLPAGHDNSGPFRRGCRYVDEQGGMEVKPVSEPAITVSKKGSVGFRA